MGGFTDGFGAVVSAGSGFADFLGNSYLQKEQTSANSRLANEAFDKESAYNDPSAQMARLRAAGLNPNLVYGTGTTGITGNTHASVPTAHLTANPGKIVSDSVERYMSLRAQHLNNDIAARTAKNLDMQNVKLAREIDNLSTDNHIKTAAAIAADRENGLLSDSFMSAHDPWYARMGGRIGSMLRDITFNRAPSASASDVDTAKPVRLEFDESQRKRYTPRTAAREVVYTYR